MRVKVLNSNLTLVCNKNGSITGEIKRKTLVDRYIMILNRLEEIKNIYWGK